MSKPLIVYLVVLLVLTVSTAAAVEENDCGCSSAVNSATDLKYKIVAIFSTLIVGLFGVCLPLFGFDPDDSGLYDCARIFGVSIMGIPSLIYFLPDATDSLTSSCIGGDFPMTGAFIARAAAILYMIESKSFASAFMNRSQDHNKIGQKLLAQFLELGMVFPSLIIGIALGVSSNLITIKYLVPAITCHQLFQGMVRGAYISKAKFGLKKTLTMVILFSLTAPLGIGIGIGVAEIYFKNDCPTSLIVSGFFNAAAAGMLFLIAGVTGYNFKPHRTSHTLLALGHVFMLR